MYDREKKNGFQKINYNYIMFKKCMNFKCLNNGKNHWRISYANAGRLFDG